MSALGLRSGAVARALALVCVLSTPWSPPAFALDPALDVGQYAHSAWRVRDGFPTGTVHAIAQTPDGYLWLGTDVGLLRFDGVKAVAWQPPGGQPLPDPWVRSLLATRDGTLFIGTIKGLVSFTGRERTSYPELAGLAINYLIEDRDGTVWVAAQTPPTGARLCAIRRAATRCDAEDIDFGTWVGPLHEDGGGRLWAASSNGLWRYRPAPAEFFATPRPVGDSFQSLAEDDDGEIVIASKTGLVRFAGGRFEPYAVQSGQASLTSVRLLKDRDGGLWIGSRDRGLVHMHEGRVDSFARVDGLSGDYVARIFEDREGSIWVSTLDGLDRFREFAAATLTASQGLSNGNVASVVAARDGSVWIDTLTGLSRSADGRITRYGEQEHGVPESSGSLFEDSRGRVWIGALGGVGYLENDRFVRAEGIAGQLVDSFAEDGAGNLWIAHRQQGLLRRSQDGAIQAFPWAELSRAAQRGRDDSVFRLAFDPRRDGLWLGFRFGGLAYFADGEVRASYSAADGLGEGQVRQIRIDDAGVWVATEGGLSRLEGNRIDTLSSRNGLPCDSVDWTIEDDAGSVWLYMACGIARIARSELDAWAAAATRNEAQSIVRATVFGSSDGVRSHSSLGSYGPHAAKSRDGRLWFAAEDGVTVLDPAHLPHNALPPPVQIEQIVADRKTYDASAGAAEVRLPPIVRDLQIDYTALSLVAPEKIQFRFRLEGRDDDWQEAGTRRQAFYTGLPPRAYRFRVIASNNDGVWNEEGASIAFTIAPAFYQTRWFAALCVAAGAGLLWLLYALRVRQIETRMAMRLDERVAERGRIARDLHDTFLQSVQGLMLKFQAVMAAMPDEPSRALLEQALVRADEVLAEGRDRVWELRASADRQDLPQALAALAAELTPAVPTRFSVSVEGEQRPLHPVVREETYRIGAEALRNAFRHAAAPRIDLEIEYARAGLSVRIIDDGRGFDVTALAGNAPGKHFGLTGLRERAKKIRSQLEVSSGRRSGTKVELRVPGVVAYAADRRPKDLLR
jgi:signal transduction histidine kinase/ligand-binding sensor domain-containing protein